jgi:hypothetical protein
MFLIALGLLCLLAVFTGAYIPPDLRGLAIPFSLGFIVLGVFFRSYLRDEDEDIRKRNNEQKAREERERTDWWNDQR